MNLNAQLQRLQQGKLVADEWLPKWGIDVRALPMGRVDARRWRPVRREEAKGVTATVTADRALRIYVPMTGWCLTGWLLPYLAMILLDAAVIIAVVEAG